jgi:hypothetical protein
MRQVLQTVFFSAIFVAFSTPSVAQPLPNTQVYSFEMERDGAGFNFKNCRYLTAFNPRGYNNQPHWVNNNELYLSIQFPHDTFQTDIFSLSLINNVISRVTATTESEYSPTLMPDRRNFSCIRVDVGRNGQQYLHAYPIDRSGEGTKLVSLHPNVGYHCWLSPNKLALFVLDGARNYLKLVNAEDQTSIQLAGGIGRCFARTNDGRLAFVQKESENQWFIKLLNPETYGSTTVAPTLNGSEDFVLLPDGTFVMGSGSQLFAFHPADADRQWKPVADLSKYGLTNIKRLALSRENDKIAIVNDLSR